jgi:hypothetical protein
MKKKIALVLGGSLLTLGLIVFLFGSHLRSSFSGSNETFKHGRTFTELSGASAYDSSAMSPKHRTGKIEGDGDDSSSRRWSSPEPVRTPVQTPRPTSPPSSSERRQEPLEPSEVEGESPSPENRNLGIEGSFNNTEKEAKPSDAKKAPLSKPETWRSASTKVHECKLEIGDQEELPLKGTQYAIQLDGFRARVLIDLYYYNDRNQRLEGSFKLRLPNEASPYFFAFGQAVYLDSSQETVPFVNYTDSSKLTLAPAEVMSERNDDWTHPKEARMVPKEKAAFAYQETVRRSVDPALLEWAGADVFNAKVFPLEARKLHHIVFGYEMNLTPLEGDYLFQLPLPETQSALLLDFDISANNASRKPQISPSTEMEEKNGRFRFQYVDPQTSQIEIRYPSAYSFLLQGKEHFAGAFTPQLPSLEEGAPLTQGIFAVDVSLSAHPEKFNIWLKLLEQILEQNANSLQEYAVLFFNIESFWWKEAWTPNTAKNRQDLLDFCYRLSLEGATDLGLALEESTSPRWEKQGGDSSFKNLFLLSDGSSTWGESELHSLISRIPSSVRLFAYHTGVSGTDSSVLGRLAQATGGALVFGSRRISN